mgnify:CR=1 FL=1
MRSRVWGESMRLEVRHWEVQKEDREVQFLSLSLI